MHTTGSHSVAQSLLVVVHTQFGSRPRKDASVVSQLDKDHVLQVRINHCSFKFLSVASIHFGGKKLSTLLQCEFIKNSLCIVLINSHSFSFI